MAADGLDGELEADDLGYGINLGVLYEAGMAYDESPVPDRYRTPRVPDADRLWTSIGLGCRLGNMTTLDLGYAHIFIREASLRRVSVAGGEDAGRGTLIGNYNNSIDIFSAQITARF